MKAYLAVLCLALATGCASIPTLEYGPDDASSGDDGSAADASSDALASDAEAIDAAIDATSDAACTLSGSTGTPACDTCIAASCCAQANACFGSADCVAIIQCSRDCATNAQPAVCRADCRNQHQAAKKVYTDVATCVAGSCKAGTCG